MNSTSARVSFRALGAGLLLVVLTGCGSTYPNRNPVGETFPTVVGKSLKGEERSLPAAYAGRPVLLLVGYVQKAQFDADRWILGVLQAGLPVKVVEVPTIDGLFPRLFAGAIDDGMREGIPAEDWADVVTVYDDAERIVAFTGNEVPRNIRVLLLDADGKVMWFHDRGYSPRLPLELARLLKDASTPAR
jgi:hypothetical protein